MTDKLKPEDLHVMRQEMAPYFLLKEEYPKVKITVHMGTCGIASGADKILETFKELINEDRGNDIILITSGCAGLCSKEPMATIQLQGEPPVKYAELTPEKVKQIFKEHIKTGRIVLDFALSYGSERIM